MAEITRADAMNRVMAAVALMHIEELVATGVRTSLDWLAAQYPGRSVEVRVPPYRVVQIMDGANHRRGTPPAVVEMTPQTWLKLFTGILSWTEGISQGLIIASGDRSDLSELF